MNQPYACINQPYATLTLAPALREIFRVQLYKNNARALLLRILSILNLDWLQHTRSVRGVYEIYIWQGSRSDQGFADKSVKKIFGGENNPKKYCNMPFLG